jgi:hypothetical protein
MSTLRNDAPAQGEVHHDAGELRRPADRHGQPGQGGSHTAPNDGHERDRRRDPAAEPRSETAPAGMADALGPAGDAAR